MSIMLVAQVEDDRNILKQLRQQTVKPDIVFIYKDANPAVGINRRRKQIASNHLYLEAAVLEHNPDFVWQVEGDCDLPNDCLERLIEDYEALKGPDFGYVSGIQVGRHGLYCLGAWKNFTEESFESLDYKAVGFQEVEATGFYCLLASKEVWLSGTAAWTDEPWGPDVNWSRSIPLKKYCDMDLSIGHILERKGKQSIIRPEHMSTCNAKFFLNKQKGKWDYKTS